MSRYWKYIGSKLLVYENCSTFCRGSFLNTMPFCRLLLVSLNLIPSLYTQEILIKEQQQNGTHLVAELGKQADDVPYLITFFSHSSSAYIL